jgi:hypothetical protein
LLRSLEMAAHAMRAPSYGFNSDTDHGVLLSLWVAAFETLANPADRVGFREVRTAIDSVPWLDSRLRTAAVRHDRRSPSARLDDIRRVSTRAGSTREALGRAKRGVLLTRPAQVYSRLYRARNVTMHGEELSRGGLEPGRRPNWGYLDLLAAALYRCVLLHAAETAGHGTYLRPSVPTAVSLHEDEVLSRMSAYHEAEMAHEIYELALRNERPFH